MNLKELAEAYRRNAEAVIKEPLKYDYRVLKKAYQLLNTDIEEELRKLASSLGGCVSCRYSTPHPSAPLSLMARSCELGLRQETCRKWEKIEFGGD